MTTSADPIAMVRALIEHVGVPTLAVLDNMDDLPKAHIFNAGGGSQTDIDRLDRVAVTVYAPAPTTDDDPTVSDVAATIHDALAGGPHETPVGYIDEVVVESQPTFQLYTDTVDSSTAVYGIIHRFTD